MAKTKALDYYNEKYIGQMRDIIKGMFAKENSSPGLDPANPDNWHMAQNVVWGGTGHQHPHCDQGKAGSFNTEQIFPFVCIHGFGLHEFVMWLLPAQKMRDYRVSLSLSQKRYAVLAGGFHSCWGVLPTHACTLGILAKSSSWMDTLP